MVSDSGLGNDPSQTRNQASQLTHKIFAAVCNMMVKVTHFPCAKLSILQENHDKVANLQKLNCYSRLANPIKCYKNGPGIREMNKNQHN